jgi:hypothetical protein
VEMRMQSRVDAEPPGLCRVPPGKRPGSSGLPTIVYQQQGS